METTTEQMFLDVPAELRGLRLDQALARLCPQHSRARLQNWIRSGMVRVDGREPRARDRLRGGEHIAIAIQHQADLQPDAEDIPLRIVYEDAELFLLDKPPGLVVHPGAGVRRHTLMNALLHHDPGLRRVPRAGIVQRLDKDTSGLMVIARTPEAHTWLVAQLKARLVRREYLALVSGVLTAGGTVDAPIGRHPRERRRMAVVAGGRPAVTHYRVLQRFAAHTLLRVMLETGRTHQIRVHMAHIRHPVVGDRVYGGRPRPPAGASGNLRNLIRSFPRQALHAGRLGLVHPATRREMHWESPMPEDMQQLIDALRRES
jgi:23S rRNA pseudouridine1911/1915/1917 synthase